MDDIRRPQRPTRRDYSLPSHRPQPNIRHAQPPSQHLHPQPVPQTQPQPHHHPSVLPSPHPAQPVYHHQQYQRPAINEQYKPPEQQARHKQPRLKSRRKIVSLTAGALLAAAAIFGAGWMLKGTSSSQTIPQSITRQVNFSLYFPSPMPTGYTYMKDTATFQIGQVYYKFEDGNKRVTVMEQPMPSKKPDLSLMNGYSIFNSAIGKAAVGSSFGQATAVVLTPTTVITLHSVGSVSQDELKTAINNMKNIGQNPKNS